MELTVDTSPGDIKAALGFDPEALREKYREERDKRMRKDGMKQFRHLTGEFADYANDPYVEPGFTRAPLTDEIDVVIIGGGLTGLMAAASLRQAGVDDIRIIENGGDFGGTWYWNRYPGIRCDVESYIYMPMLEEVGTIPTEKYTRGREIFAHLQALGRQFGLYEKACFQTQLTAVQWDEDAARWIIETDRGDRMKARFLFTGTGVLSKPKLPGIPGITSYKGHSFHSSRWDYAYTGGDETGNLSKLADKKVAIIGTGATGVQIIPYLARDAKELVVFQRTPSAVDVRGNRATDMEWVKSLAPGWQKQRMINFQAILIGMAQDEDLVGDCWTDTWHQIAEWSKNGFDALPDADFATLMQMADYKKMEEIRQRIEDIVEDPATAAALKPWYNLWCKRPLFSDEYYQTFNRPNVTLVSTNGRSVDRITETGLEFDGRHYDADCIIYASGFDLGSPTYEAGSYRLIGRGGVDLADKWRGGVSSLHGIMTRGFPNMFIIGGIAQAGVTLNFPHILREQAEHVAAFVAHCIAQGVTVTDVKPEAEQRWGQMMVEKAIDRSQFDQDCTPSTLNNEGARDAGPTLFGSAYGGGPFEYRQIIDDWREGDFAADLEITR